MTLSAAATLLLASTLATLKALAAQIELALAPETTTGTLYVNGIGAPNEKGAVRLQWFDEEIYPANKELIDLYNKGNPFGGKFGPNFFLHDELVPFQLTQEQINRASTNCGAADFDWRPPHWAFDSGYDAKGIWQNGDALPNTSAYNEATIDDVKAAILRELEDYRKTPKGDPNAVFENTRKGKGG